MLIDIGCKFVILGHSERRDLLRESNADVNKKLKAALASGLLPIVCVGEHLEEREAGKTASVIKSQFEGSFEGISAEQMPTIVIAYEPVWAIGTGLTAKPSDVAEVHGFVRRALVQRFGAEGAAMRILYGGSVKPDNARELMAIADVNGALVGGASLKADDFLAIIAACRA